MACYRKSEWKDGWSRWQRPPCLSCVSPNPGQLSWGLTACARGRYHFRPNGEARAMDKQLLAAVRDDFRNSSVPEVPFRLRRPRIGPVNFVLPLPALGGPLTGTGHLAAAQNLHHRAEC